MSNEIMSRRDTFAAAAMNGILSSPTKLSEGDNYLRSVVQMSLECADEAMKLSAPDAIEALKELVKEWHTLFSEVRVHALTQAETVLARYEENKE